MPSKNLTREIEVDITSKHVINDIDHGDNVRVRIVASDDNWIESDAIAQLKKTAELPGMKLAVGLPDLHPGKGQPIGAAFVTENIIYPHLVGSDIGCGMALYEFNKSRRKLKLDKLEKQLRNFESIDEEVADCVDSPPDLSAFDFPNELNKKLGTVGGGNHFFECQSVHEIIDEAAFDCINVNKNSLFLLVHSGSRGLGQHILTQHVSQYGGAGIKDDSADQYLLKHNFANDWAVLNRQVIADKIERLVGSELKNILDVSHNHVYPLSASECEALQLNTDQKYWIHRKGASPSNQGLVMIPGSRGSLSYLVKPVISSNGDSAISGFSLAHGAGRKWKRSDCKGRISHRFTVKELESTPIGSRVICENRNLLYEEAPQAYKNIDGVVSDLVDAGLITVIASFKPVISFKTTRK